MHELSLALEVCRLAGEVLEREGGVSVRSIGVEVGDDSGVEFENFRFCLDALLGEELCVCDLATLHLLLQALTGANRFSSRSKNRRWSRDAYRILWLRGKI